MHDTSTIVCIYKYSSMYYIIFVSGATDPRGVQELVNAIVQIFSVIWSSLVERTCTVKLPPL